MSDASGDHTVDEIAHDTARTFRAILAFIAAWIKLNRNNNGGYDRKQLGNALAHKLGTERIADPRYAKRVNNFRSAWISRHANQNGGYDQKQLADAMARQLGAERIAAAWYTKRVDDYRVEVAAVRERQLRPGYTREAAQYDQQRLGAIRHRIETTLHDCRPLAVEYRGQVVQALDIVHRDPTRALTEVFPRMTAQAATAARIAAIASEVKTTAVQAQIEQTRVRADTERHDVELNRASRAARQEARDPALRRSAFSAGASRRSRRRPDRPVIAAPTTAAPIHDHNPALAPALVHSNGHHGDAAAKVAAVQGIRVAQTEWAEGRRRHRRTDPAKLDRLEQRRHTAAATARAAGLSEDRITYEINNARRNSAVRVTVAASSPGHSAAEPVVGLFPHQREASQWTRLQVQSTRWSRGTRLLVDARRRRNNRELFCVAGDHQSVRQWVGGWAAKWHKHRSATRRSAGAGLTMSTTIRKSRRVVNAFSRASGLSRAFRF